MSAEKDIPLDIDGSTKILPWIIAFMVYIASLAMAGGMILSDVAQVWGHGLTGNLTIQLPITQLETENDINRRIKKAIKALENMQGIDTIEVMSQAEIKNLLEPWLGQNIDPSSLPIPRLITVTMKSGAVDLNELRRRLIAVIPDIIIDDHQLWREQMLSLMQALQLVAMTIVFIVAVAGIIIVIFATKGGLATHRAVIELLHLIGAYDHYIAKQFQRHSSRSAFRGAMFGVFFAAVTIISLAYIANQLTNNTLDLFVLNIWQWFALAAIPFITALIAMLSARRTVITTLKQMI